MHFRNRKNVLSVLLFFLAQFTNSYAPNYDAYGKNNLNSWGILSEEKKLKADENLASPVCSESVESLLQI